VLTIYDAISSVNLSAFSRRPKILAAITLEIPQTPTRIFPDMTLSINVPQGGTNHTKLAAGITRCANPYNRANYDFIAFPKGSI